MIQQLVLLMAAMLAVAFAVDDPVESIKKKITKAEEAHRLELAKAQAEVIKWLDSREASARKKGEKATVNTVKHQREKLETEGTIPKPIPVNTSRKVDTARDLLDASYASLMKEALVANLDDLADEIEEKRVQLTKEKLDSNVFKAVRHFAKNLVKNGSFEYPEVPDDHPDRAITATAIGWKENQQTITKFIGTIPIHGEQTLGIASKSAVEQEISGLVAGERYVVTGWAGSFATPNAPSVSNELKVSIAGEFTKIITKASIGASKTGYAMPGKNAKWEQFTLVFKALGETHELKLENLNVDKSPRVLVDQVSILPFFDN